MLFHQVQGAQVVLKTKGVWKQSDVYVFGERLFAKHGGGFIGLKLYENGTTIPNCRWEHIEGVEYRFGPAPAGDMLKGKETR